MSCEVERVDGADDGVVVGQRAVADRERLRDQRAHQVLETAVACAGVARRPGTPGSPRSRRRRRRTPSGSPRTGPRCGRRRSGWGPPRRRAPSRGRCGGTARRRACRGTCRRSSRGTSAWGRRARRGARPCRGRRRGCRCSPARRRRRSAARTAPRTARFSASVCATPAGDGSTSRSARSATHSASVRQSIAGVLAPTPRGSNPTKSNRLPSGLSASCGPSDATMPRPDAPGPPGLNSSEPMRCPVAFWRSTATLAVGPSGAA